MREIEVKILKIDRNNIEKKLISIGARKTFEGDIHAIYYDSSDNLIRKTRATLRLRREGARSVLTFKQHIEDEEAKIREEKEVEVSDFDTMHSVLVSLGFFSWLEMEKYRITYEFGGAHFEIDKYHGEYEYIPEFMEIEGADIGEIYKYAGLLGFSSQDCKPWDAVQLAAYYNKPVF